jgi:predicted DNA-binding transcriptional regulator
MSEKEKSLNLESELFGNRQRFRIYWYMISKNGPVGVREVQRELGISSPSVVHHHLEKLTRAGIVDLDEYGRYCVTKKVEVGVLQAFTRVGRFLLPRFSFYAVFMTTSLLLYIILLGAQANVFALAFGGAGSAFSWYETYVAWRRKPF